MHGSPVDLLEFQIAHTLNVNTIYRLRNIHNIGDLCSYMVNYIALSADLLPTPSLRFSSYTPSRWRPLSFPPIIDCCKVVSVLQISICPSCPGSSVQKVRRFHNHHRNLGDAQGPSFSTEAKETRENGVISRSVTPVPPSRPTTPKPPSGTDQFRFGMLTIRIFSGT